MASLIDKIKHKINPQTKDIKDGEAQVIGSYVKDIQEQAASLSKKARKIKQLIKSDVEIKPDDAKKIAKELFASNTSGFETLTCLFISFKNISENLGLEKTAEKLGVATEKAENAKTAAKSEAAKANIKNTTNKTNSSDNTDDDVQEAVRLVAEDEMINTFMKHFSNKLPEVANKATLTKYYILYCNFVRDINKTLQKFFPDKYNNYRFPTPPNALEDAFIDNYFEKPLKIFQLINKNKNKLTPENQKNLEIIINLFEKLSNTTAIQKIYPNMLTN